MQKYKAKFSASKTCVCIVNDVKNYSVDKQIVINRADYTISNLTGIGYDVFEDTSIDKLLLHVSKSYDYAVVISAGTEFINGNTFFDNHPKEYELIAHILDGGDAYYGIHPQCFSINLTTYIDLGSPKFGKEEPFSSHVQHNPMRSYNNIHDDYLPTWVAPGKIEGKYKHKLPGWNLISAFLNKHKRIETYSAEVREGKFYLYTKGETTSYVYQKYNYCLTTHVHDTATGKANSYPRPYNTPVYELVTPANKHAAKLRSPTALVKYYDYNQTALDSVGGGFHCDPINDPESFVKWLSKHDPQGTVIDMSNIFCYEGTAMMYSLQYRVQQENKLITLLQQELGDATIIFDQRAAEGIQSWVAETGLIKDLQLTDFENLDLPSWHQTCL